jgi:hypothetical protein
LVERMRASLEHWQQVHRIFDPMRPAPADLRQPRERYNPLSEVIVPRLRLPVEHEKLALAGGIGSGMSTELLATASAIQDGKLVILVDLWRHFEDTVVDPGALDHLQPAEQVGLLGLAVLRTGSDLLGHDWQGHQDALAAAITAVQGDPGAAPGGPTLDVVKLARGVAVFVGRAAGGLTAGPAGAVAGSGVASAGLTLLDAVAGAGSWEWKIGLRGRKRSSDQDEPTRQILFAVNALLDDLRASSHREVVLLVDGLDRVQSAATFEDLFVESSLVADLRCQAVLTLHQGLSQRFRARLRGYRVFDFTHVPVVLAGAPDTADPAGLAFFRGLAARRFRHARVPDLVPADQLDRLASSSGGRVRDLVHLVRELAVQAMLDGVDVAGAAQVDKVIDLFRRDRESGLNTGHITVLRGVRDDPDHRLPEGDLALDLLDRQLLLAYPNESTWYLPHPILRRLLRPRTGAGAST